MNTTGLVKYGGALVTLAVCSACAGGPVFTGNFDTPLGTTTAKT